jgi:peptide/nickel transport system substrate-binding protein
MADIGSFFAMAALRSGEIDWWEAPLHDQAEAFARDRDITVVAEYATAMGILRFNHLDPPFNNVAVRQAPLGAAGQLMQRSPASKPRYTCLR